ncbi:MAG: tetratricopeptide repeat protein [Candidatus Methylacidiphilales bacterium]
MSNSSLALARPGTGTSVVLGGTAFLLAISPGIGLSGWAVSFAVVWLILGWQAVRLAVLAPVFPEKFGDKADVYAGAVLLYLVAWHFFASSRFYSILELFPWLAGAVLYFSCRYGGVYAKGVELLRGLWFTAIFGVGIACIQYVVCAYAEGASASHALSDAAMLPMLGGTVAAARECALFCLIAFVISLVCAVRPGHPRAFALNELPQSIAAGCALLFLTAAIWLGVFGPGATRNADFDSRAFCWGLLIGLLTSGWLIAAAVPATRGNGTIRTIVIRGLPLMALGGWFAGLIWGGSGTGPRGFDAVWLEGSRWLSAPVFGAGPGSGIWSFGSPLASYMQWIVAYGVIGFALAMGAVWVLLSELGVAFEHARQTMLSNGRSRDGVVSPQLMADAERLSFAVLAIACWAVFLGYGVTNTVQTGPWALMWLGALTGLALRPHDAATKVETTDFPVFMPAGQQPDVKLKPGPRWILRGAAILLGLSAAMLFVSTLASWRSAALWLSSVAEMRRLTSGKEMQLLTATRLREMDALRESMQWAAWWDRSTPLPHRFIGDTDRYIAAALLTQGGTNGPSAADREQAATRLSSAIDAYQKALKLNAFDSASSIGLATAYGLAQKQNEALETFANVLRSQPNDGRIWTALAWKFAHTGQPGEALEAMERGEYCDVGRDAAVSARLKLAAVVRPRGDAQDKDSAPAESDIRPGTTPAGNSDKKIAPGNAQDFGQEDLIVP